MALNSGAINSHAINASSGFVSSIGGGGAVVTIEQIVNATGTSTSNIVQAVTVKSATNPSVASIVQIVELHSTSTTAEVVTIEQTVNAKATPTIDVEQLVVDPNAVDFYSRNGYEPRLFIDQARVDNDEIHGNIEVFFQENQAPQLRFTLIPPTGTQDIAGYRGKLVVLNIRESGGTTRVFTGKINEPDVEIINQKINFDCSLDIEQKVEDDVTRSFLNTVGYYNNQVFSKPLTQLQELQDRISTVPQTIDWDRTGSIMINDIAPKATQDYTLTDSDIRYTNDLDYRFSSRQRYVNKVEITANFNFQRLHLYRISYSLSNQISICDFLTRSATPIRRDLVLQAVNGTGWVVDGLTFTDFYNSGFYSCNGSTIGFLTQTAETKATPSLDEDGNQITTDGNNQYETIVTSITDIGGTYCLGASWKASKRFIQNVGRKYTLTVTAPQSTSDYGDKLREESFTLTDEYTSEDWESYTKYDGAAPDGFSITGTSGNNFWVDAITNNGKFDTSAEILLNRAKSIILKSHRDDRVVFKRSLWTDIQLNHTVRVNTSRVVAKGKVFNYRHIIDVNTGEAYTLVELALSRSTGSTSETDLKLPTIDMSPVDPVYPISAISLGSKYGVDPTTESEPQGFYGNWLRNDGRGTSKTEVTSSLTVTAPGVEDALRENIEVEASQTYNVSIPNDELTVIFTDT